MNNKLLYFTLIIGVIMLSTSAIFVKIAQAPSSIIAFYRLLITFIITFSIIICDKNKINELKSLNKKEILLGLSSGIFLSFHYLFWFESLNYTSVTSSTVIATMQPIFSVIGSYFFFREKYSKKSIIFIFISILGSGIIGFSDSQLKNQELYGDILAFISAIIMTFYFFIGQHLRKKISVVSYSTLGYFTSTIILFIYSISKSYSFTNYNFETIISFILIAIISTIFGQMVLNWLLKWFNATTISMGVLTEPIFATILSIIILNDKIYFKQVIGMLFVFLGLLFFLNSIKKVKSNT